MEHRLIHGIEKALGWSGPSQLGAAFALGHIDDMEVCTRLLTPTRLLDLVMRRSLAPHRLRILADGGDVHPQQYLPISTARRGWGVPMADMRRVGGFLRSGCTLILDEVNTYDPTMEVACRALQWWADELVQVNCYLTTGTSGGFNLHWDDHDVLVVQLAGEKAWEVRGLSRVAPMYRDAEPNLEPSEETVWTGIMRPGDVMHIPRGYWHRATREDRGDGFSLHATFGIPKRTGVDWLTWVADQGRERELLRHDLLRTGTDAQRNDQRLDLLDEAIRLVTSQPIAEFLTRRNIQRPAARHIQTHSLFGPLTDVVCVTEFAPLIERGDESVVVAAGGRRITFAAAALPALDIFLGGSPVSVADAVAAVGDSAAVVARALVDEDICAELTPELASGYADMVTAQVR
ncbi:JmjC domain-containing protein [Kibdelosporangium aridum]|uniref:Cupin superfamily protein n=1 Tax=Kibdelosporangium aridum TaxID=2030 RepID=A0A1W2EY00_KIBAR|nr:cupin domain-containing protein [Kibdelosporangium aridum]SMD14583.1 Cupin superfamily protein [Kibdelosporangium aridum]